MDVILKLNPFTIYQTVIKKTKSTIETDKIQLNQINNFLFSLPEGSNVLFSGNINYISRYIKEYEKEELAKYSKKRINIVNEIKETK